MKTDLLRQVAQWLPHVPVLLSFLRNTGRFPSLTSPDTYVDDTTTWGASVSREPRNWHAIGEVKTGQSSGIDHRESTQ